VILPVQFEQREGVVGVEVLELEEAADGGRGAGEGEYRGGESMSALYVR
jgi:hypothetical protein